MTRYKAGFYWVKWWGNREPVIAQTLGFTTWYLTNNHTIVPGKCMEDGTFKVLSGPLQPPAQLDNFYFWGVRDAA